MAFIVYCGRGWWGVKCICLGTCGTVRIGTSREASRAAMLHNATYHVDEMIEEALSA
jgi:hypothetical protein